MKRFVTSLSTLALILLCCLSSCGTPDTPTVTTPSATSGDDPSARQVTTSDTQTTPPETSAKTEVEPTPAAPKSLRILAIGNSFSSDCMQYLYQIMKSGGVEEIVLGNLYYGGCSLAQHLDFAQNDKNVYTYYKNTSGAWVTNQNYRLSDAVKDEDWDYISFQQTSKTCGIASTYGKTLTSLLDIVEKQAPEAKFIWNMTWAYQQDSTHASFPSYGKSQQKMYDMIIDCVKDCIEPESRFKIIIPCMTSIQNARTSFLGDTLTRDGYHMDYYIGRYIVGLTWFSAITGLSPDAVTYNPSASMISDDMLAVAREAVANAMEQPNSVTQSKITTGKRGEGLPARDPSLVLNPADFYEADTRLAATQNIYLSKYRLLEWDYVENGYWNCTKNATITSPTSGSTFRQNVCTKEKFSIADLPAGSVFVCDEGWQYRLELYQAAERKYTGTRPAMNTSPLVVLTEEFLKDANFLAWNISSNPKSDISDIYAQAACHVRIYVPVS